MYGNWKNVKGEILDQEEENNSTRNVGYQDKDVSRANPGNQEEQRRGREQWEVQGKEKKSLNKIRKEKQIFTRASQKEKAK